MPMVYHCGHVYHVFSTVAEGIFGEEGKEMSKLVLLGVEKIYGKEAANILKDVAGLPFDTIAGVKTKLRESLKCGTMNA